MFVMNAINTYIRLGLNAIGAWPGISTANFFFVMLTVLIFNLIFQIWNTVTVIRKLNLLMINLSAIAPITSVVMQLFAFYPKYGKVRYIITEILEDWNSKLEFTERRRMIKNARIAELLVYAFVLSFNALITAYLGIAIFSYNSQNINDRQFVLPANFPIDAKQSPIFEIVCFVQFMSAFFVANVHAVLEGFLTITVLHVNSKAFGVCREITKMSEICKTNSSATCILKAKQSLIKTHLNFLTFVEYLEDIFSYMSFFHLFIMTFLNCAIGYMLMTSINEDRIFTIICLAYIVSILFAVGSYCLAGEYLTFQGTIIFYELYNCPWYMFKSVDAKLIIIMIMRSRQPINISVGKFGVLSLIYFTQIMKASVSYLSLLRASSR